uniref:Uncharacterized protein n=1 Tax=Rhizophora mucronata TaxID=61149 RepID=A0A2P2JL34_RHIMU
MRNKIEKSRSKYEN